MKNCRPQRYDPYSLFGGNWNAWQNDHLHSPTLREVASFSETTGGQGTVRSFPGKRPKIASISTQVNTPHNRGLRTHTHTHKREHTLAQWEVGSARGYGMWKTQRYTPPRHSRTLVLRGYFIKRFNLSEIAPQCTCFRSGLLLFTWAMPWSSLLGRELHWG